MTGISPQKGPKILRVVLWVCWTLWGLACAVLLVGASANYLASRTQALPLVLIPGETAEVTVYRFIDDRLRLRLRYADEGQSAASGADGTDLEPEVLLRIETPTDRADFRAAARSGVAGQDINRALQSVEPDRFAASYFGYGRGDALPRGRSWLRVTVLETGPALAGRPASVELLPPLDLLKLTDLDYVWLWPFFFWKIAAMFLLVPGVVLAIFTVLIRRQARQ